MRKRSFHDWWRQIAATRLTHTEKAVLVCLAAHADWQTGQGAYPSVATIAQETGLGRRTVQRTLSSLACQPAQRARCTGTGCKHHGLISRRTAPGRAAIYDLTVAETGVQQHLPEIADDPFAHLVLRDWPRERPA